MTILCQVAPVPPNVKIILHKAVASRKKCKKQKIVNNIINSIVALSKCIILKIFFITHFCKVTACFSLHLKTYEVYFTLFIIAVHCVFKTHICIILTTQTGKSFTRIARKHLWGPEERHFSDLKHIFFIITNSKLLNLSSCLPFGLKTVFFSSFSKIADPSRCIRFPWHKLMHETNCFFLLLCLI